jgi:hypothetical protein
LAIAELSRQGRLPFENMRRWAAAALAVVFLLGGGAFLIQAGSAAYRLAHHWRTQTGQFDRALDDYWNDYMAGATRAIQTHRERPVLTLWSEYAALLDAHYGTFQAAEDYIIHAVGWPRWQHYLDAFRTSNPEFVTTMTPQFSFAELLQDTHWEFYEDLLNNYQPIAEVEHAIIWQRSPGPWVLRSQAFQPLTLNDAAGDAAAQSVTLPVSPDQERIAVVLVHYQISNSWRKLPVLGLTPRYLATVEGTARNNAISFPPDLTEFQFPVKLQAGKAVTLRFRTDTLLPHAAMHVKEVDWKLLPPQPGLSQMFAQRIIPSRW